MCKQPHLLIQPQIGGGMRRTVSQWTTPLDPSTQPLTEESCLLLQNGNVMNGNRQELEEEIHLVVGIAFGHLMGKSKDHVDIQRSRGEFLAPWPQKWTPACSETRVPGRTTGVSTNQGAMIHTPSPKKEKKSKPVNRRPVISCTVHQYSSPGLLLEFPHLTIMFQLTEPRRPRPAWRQKSTVP